MFDCEDLGDNTVVLTVTDQGGLSDMANCTVVVQDNMAPETICPTENLIVMLDAEGSGTLAADALAGLSTDNCTVASEMLS